MGFRCALRNLTTLKQLFLIEVPRVSSLFLQSMGVWLINGTAQDAKAFCPLGASTDEVKYGAINNKILASRHMRPAQIAEAQRLVRSWQEKHQNSAQMSPNSVVKTPAATDIRADHKRIERIQRQLNSLGYDAGPADGNFGPRTRAAIRAFEAREKLPVSGEISESLEDELRAALLVIPTLPGPPQAR